MRPARHRLRACSNSSRASGRGGLARRPLRRPRAPSASASGSLGLRRLLRLPASASVLVTCDQLCPASTRTAAAFGPRRAPRRRRARRAPRRACRLRRVLVRDRKPRPDHAHFDAARRDDERPARPVGHVARDAAARQHQLHRRRRAIADLDARPRLQLQARAIDQRHRQRVGRGLQLRPLPGRHRQRDATCVSEASSARARR